MRVAMVIKISPLLHGLLEIVFLSASVKSLLILTLATLFATDKILRSHKSEIREKHRYSFPHFFPFSSQELLMLVIDLIYLFCTAEHMFKDSRMFFFLLCVD